MDAGHPGERRTRRHWGIPRNAGESPCDPGTSGDLGAQSKPAGTEVELTVPGSMAYSEFSVDHGPIETSLSEHRHGAGRIGIRIFRVDDHPLCAMESRLLVGGQDEWRMVAEASNGREAIGTVPRLALPMSRSWISDATTKCIRGITAIRKNAPGRPHYRITTYSGDVQVTRALEAGARAYLLKNLLHKNCWTHSSRCMPEGRRCRRHCSRLAERFGEDA